ncbi:uncharacterized protein LOC112046165 [Bicyclus anynana]|uniref:Uncharacterized protein LOC112046165 n=1 Tax=Bicyclus anynana TaxID=110368 RepID=A0A6J1N652_BICAN|nr:uncharacterized protein LOC112046165 [Bicyclus anynana]
MFRSPWDQSCVKLDTAPSNADEVFGCDICSDGGWTSETEVELHKTKKHYTKEFMDEIKMQEDYCYICIKSFSSKEDMMKHIRTEHLLSSPCSYRVERQTFVCDLCSAIFFNKQNLVIHLKYGHLENSVHKLIKCVLCLRNIQIRNISAHFYMHNIQSVSTCRICLHKCHNCKALKEHMKSHPLYLKCEMCFFETSRLDAFQNHIVTSHKKNNATVTDEKTKDNAKKATASKTNDNGKSKRNLVNTDNTNTIMMKDSDDDMTGDEYLTVIEICDDDPSQQNKNLAIADIKIENENLNLTELKQESIDDVDLNILKEELIVKDNFMIDENIVKQERDDDFKRYFIPKMPAYVKLQRVAGIRGIKLSNDVRICVLCREICVTSDEMKSHVEEHKKVMKTNKENTYECSCGESFTNKVLLKHHAFKTKHVIGKF